MKGELVERSRATALVFRLAREERDTWVTWPARIAALMAAELGDERLNCSARAQLTTHIGRLRRYDVLLSSGCPVTEDRT
jgi:hypothetical protein